MSKARSHCRDSTKVQAEQEADKPALRHVQDGQAQVDGSAQGAAHCHWRMAKQMKNIHVERLCRHHAPPKTLKLISPPVIGAPNQWLAGRVP